MAVEKQNADGSYSGVREKDGAELWRAGGYAGPAGTNVPEYLGGSSLVFNVAGGTDTAGGLLSWQNNLGYDIMVTSHQLHVQTQSAGACTVSFGGTSTSGTTLASNMISGQSVAATGVFNGGALSVLVPNGKWLTGSTATGASSGLVARAYFSYIPAGAAGAN